MWLNKIPFVRSEHVTKYIAAQLHYGNIQFHDIK